MHLPNISTALPTLAPGEPGCSDARALPSVARQALLSAASGTLRRCGSGWYGPDKGRPFPHSTIRTLIKRNLMFCASPNAARLTRRGHWGARTLCTEIAGLSYCVEINGTSNFIRGTNECRM